MTKYECRCVAHKPCRCVIECSIGFAPLRCCLTGDSSCNWRRVENQEVETPVPKVPEWCKIGAWVWNDEIGYGKIEQEPRTGELLVFFGGGTRAFEAERYKEARLRPWTYKEAIGKTVFWKFDNSKKEIASMIDRADDEGNVYVFGYGELKAKKLMMEERFSQSDGLPCGVLEHKNEEGEWVE